MTTWRKSTRKVSSAVRTMTKCIAVSCLLAWAIAFEALAAPNRVMVSWSPSADPATAGYCLYYGNASGNYSTRVDTGTNTSTTVSNLQGGLTYYFVATAYNGARVESNPSSEAKFTLSTNSVPTLATVPGQFVNVLDQWSITNTASENGLAVRRFTYSLDPGAPYFMEINPTNGVLSWMPLFSNAGKTYTVTVRATDNQVPPATTTNTFAVVVGHFAQLNFSSCVTAAGQTNSISMTMTSSIALTNLSFTLDAPVGRVGGMAVISLNPQAIGVTQQPAGAYHSVVTVTSLNGQALPMQTPLLQVNFTATAGQHSTFSSLNASSVNAIQADGTALPKAAGGSGRLVLIGPEPLVEAQQNNGLRSLVLYGNVGKHFTVQSTTNPKSQSVWSTAASGTLTNQTQIFNSIPLSAPAIFYRAYTF